MQTEAKLKDSPQTEFANLIILRESAQKCIISHKYLKYLWGWGTALPYT